jgi:hypothetical protein
MHEPNAMEAVVGWLDAMRRGDIDAAAEWFDPEVSWRGLGETVCRNRVDVLEMLGDSLVPCPEDPGSFDEPGLRGAVAVELVCPDAQTVVLGAKVAGMSEVNGVSVDGQLYNVFRVLGGRIVEVTDFARRGEAFAAADTQAPGWL